MPRRRLANSAAVFTAPLRAFSNWLHGTPLTDPVDRRNAPMLQVLLILVGIFVPVMMILRLQRNWLSGIDMTGELISLLTTALAWFCLYLVRTGRYRLAAGMFIGASLILMGVAYGIYGLRAQLPAQVTHVYPMVLGGLLLGRRALWLIMASMAIILVVGALKDLGMAMEIAPLRAQAHSNFQRSLLGFVILAIILDRTVAALRESLKNAARREHELFQAHDRLEREMIEKERSQAQLVHSRKIETVGRLAGGIAHDINNLLAVILGYASRSRARSDPAVAAQVLDGIAAAAQRGGTVTRRLLALNRSNGLAPRMFDARTAIRDTESMIGQMIGDGIQLSVRIDDDGPLLIKLDPADFQLALLNIAANARDAMPDGGRFDITVTGTEGTVVVTLADSGAGMDAEIVERIFDPFFTTKPEDRGTGIGLAVVHRTIADSGGSIDVDSSPGHGTTFRLVLPRFHHPAASGQTAARQVPAGTNASAPTVLLVEDDNELRPLVQETLRESGFRVIDAVNGNQALRRLGDIEHVDAIICDFHLPDTDTPELLDLLAKRFPDARIVVISSDTCALAGMRKRDQRYDTLAKPLAPSDLVDLMGTGRG